MSSLKAKTVKEPKESYWQKHISNWRRSGKTRDAYCKQHKLPLKTFIYWRKKLQAGEKNLKGKQLTAVNVIRSPISAEPVIRFRHTSGCIIDLPANLATPQLQLLFNFLGELLC